MKYSMDGQTEFSRLQMQANIENYSIINEMKYFRFDEGDNILDAGCGSGIFIDYIKSLHFYTNIYGVDISSIRIQQLNEKYKGSINLVEGSVENLPYADNKFDKVFNRYVLEHLQDPKKALKEFYRVLSPNGKLCLIDIDGILFNLSTDNLILKTYLNKLQEKFKFNLFIGRDLKRIVIESGFKNVQMNIEVMSFEGEELKKEIENYDIRLETAKEVIIEILGNEMEFKTFKRKYLDELSKTDYIFYNKFFIEGTKI